VHVWLQREFHVLLEGNDSCKGKSQACFTLNEDNANDLNFFAMLLDCEPIFMVDTYICLTMHNFSTQIKIIYVKLGH
jgi:hypothetical protein